MYAYRINAALGLDGLTLDDAPQPVPGRGEVLVQMRAAAMNFRDLIIIKGRYPGLMPNGLIPLSDGAGEVVEIGPGVDRFAVGDRVCGTFFESWQGGSMRPEDNRFALGGTLDGVLAEYRVFPQHGLVNAPPHLSFEEAACLPCAALAAWSALYDLIPLRTGQTVLTLGTGGVSIFAIQFAKLAGARVIATSSSDEKLARLRELGVVDTINYRKIEKWDAEVLRLTGGVGVDHVIEVVGPGTMQQSLASTRMMGGCVHMIGVLTPGTIDPRPIVARRILRGVLVGSQESFVQMNAAITEHKIRPVIDKIFQFADAKAAYRRIESGEHLGKVVISIAS